MTSSIYIYNKWQKRCRLKHPYVRFQGNLSFPSLLFKAVSFGSSQNKTIFNSKQQVYVTISQRLLQLSKFQGIINFLAWKLKETGQSIQWTQGYTFNTILMVVTKSTKISLIRTYFLIHPLISRCENLKMLSRYCSYDLLL